MSQWKHPIETIGIRSQAEVNQRLLKAIASSHPDGSKRYRWIGDKERLVQHIHKPVGRIMRA